MSKRDEWCCPRCGLEGDRLRTPDPQRCSRCCRIDAADDLYEALLAYHRANRIHNDADAELFAKSTAALRKARSES